MRDNAHHESKDDRATQSERGESKGSRGALPRDAQTLIASAGGQIDVAIVLGSGLSQIFAARDELTSVPYDRLPSLPFAALAGHAGKALAGTLHGKRIVAFAGRAHLYQGFSAQQVVTPVHLAHAAGATTLLLTNAAGALNTAYRPGDIMLIEDHLNLTGANPLANPGEEHPFVDMLQAYDPQLRHAAREITGNDDTIREGVYAALLGPSYETPAEARYLRSIGADAVGMSTVLETIAARHLGMRVFGASVITNIVGAPGTSHDEVTDVATSAAPRLAKILEGLIQRLSS